MPAITTAMAVFVLATTPGAHGTITPTGSCRVTMPHTHVTYTCPRHTPTGFYLRVEEDGSYRIGRRHGCLPGGWCQD